MLSLCGWNAIYQCDDYLGAETVLSGVVSEGPEYLPAMEFVFYFSLFVAEVSGLAAHAADREQSTYRAWKRLESLW